MGACIIGAGAGANSGTVGVGKAGPRGGIAVWTGMLALREGGAVKGFLYLRDAEPGGGETVVCAERGGRFMPPFERGEGLVRVEDESSGESRRIWRGPAEENGGGRWVRGGVDVDWTGEASG